MIDFINNYFTRKQVPILIDELIFMAVFTTILILILKRFSSNPISKPIYPIFIYPAIMVLFLLFKYLNIYNIETLPFNGFINYLALGLLFVYVYKAD
jgi:hypothetical protein